MRKIWSLDELRKLSDDELKELFIENFRSGRFSPVLDWRIRIIRDERMLQR